MRSSRRPEGIPSKVAYVIRSLKHPDEVRALRRIYGGGFYLIALTSTEDERREYLHNDKGCSAEEIAALLKRDMHEDDGRFLGPEGQNYGQRTRDTFQLADVFLSLENDQPLERFLRLVFASPFETPTADEYAMFLAFGASLRSGDLSRQVGAVVLSACGDVVAVGANDVPRAGGGLYWPGPDDQRDHQRGADSNEARREVILKDVLDRLRPEGFDEASWMADGTERLKGSLLMDITEYGRATHAEMEAMLSCARSGVSSRGGTVFSTTFPCHNCAKHIVTAGISRVVYVEPYPKSQAGDLFSDSITLQRDGRRVSFEPFVGVTSRRFIDLFSLSQSSGTAVKRKRPGGRVQVWVPQRAAIRVPLVPNSYLDREKLAVDQLHAITEPETHEEDLSQHVDAGESRDLGGDGADLE